MLRGGCLPLEIEKGRYKKPKVPLNESVCKMQKNKCIEDEHHFIMNCPFYDDLREDLCQHYCEINDGFNDLSMDKMFNLIMKTGDHYTVKPVLKMYTMRYMFV